MVRLGFGPDCGITWFLPRITRLPTALRMVTTGDILEAEECHREGLIDELVEEGEALETHDRKHAGPGGEPECPRCGTAMVRSVEKHPGPRSDESPFRVRLVCGSAACRAWTLYNW